MSEPTTPSHTAFRYMTRFHCIGGDCEATCCAGGWNITVDKEHYEASRRAMSTHPATRQEFDNKFRRVKDPARKSRHYALMVLQDNGACSFFGEDRLCNLQQRYGESVLSDTCAIYPRTLARSGQRKEQTGLTSCPEVSRQLLLYEDAMDMVAVEPESLGRQQPLVQLEEHPNIPYVKYHDELRNLMIDLLSDTAYPLRSRLGFVAYFAYRTQSFLSRNVAELDEERLMQEADRVQDAALRLELHKQFSSLDIDPVFATRVVYTLVKARSRVTAFGTLLRDVLANYCPPGTESAAQSEAAPVQAMLQGYLKQKEHWAPFAGRIDRYFANYAKNYWAREWYVGSPDLLTHTVQLLTRLCVLRFTLLGHPLLIAAAQAPEPERALALDKAVVDTVYNFSRAFEHDGQFIKHLKEQLATSNLITLAHASCLISF
ncbi:MAG TPA: flagellin lysine-N-methylase [Polyangiales bacterium]|nr:flagellin lysine-N-methylase [Polyangiales bacterium]